MIRRGIFRFVNSVRRSESGNIMFALFGAVAMVGVLGAASMTVLKGPVRTMSEVTKRTVAENAMIASGKLAIMAATQSQANAGNCDSDTYVEPIQFEDPAGGHAPAGGGYLPSSIGASLNDPWQTRYAYCAWDHGSDTMLATCEDPPGTNNRLAGIDGDTQAVLAVISAGPDRLFQTKCLSLAEADDPLNGGDNNGILDGNEKLLVKVPGADDLVMSYTYAEANAAGGGLWSIKSGEPGTATIDKDIEVMDASGTDVVFGLDRTTGLAEFMAMKTDNIFPKSVPNVAEPLFTEGLISLHSPLKLHGMAGDPPASGGGGGGDSLWLDDGPGGPAEIYYNGGNVGIGTNDPAAGLHIDAGGYASIQLGAQDATGFHITKATPDNSFNIWSGAHGSGTNRFRINATGEVGIGDSSPDTGLKLDVEGKVGATEYCDQNGANCTAAASLGGGGLPGTAEGCASGDTLIFNGTDWSCSSDLPTWQTSDESPVASVRSSSALSGVNVTATDDDGAVTYTRRAGIPGCP